MFLIAEQNIASLTSREPFILKPQPFKVCTFFKNLLKKFESKVPVGPFLFVWRVYLRIQEKNMQLSAD